MARPIRAASDRPRDKSRNEPYLGVRPTRVFERLDILEFPDPHGSIEDDLDGTIEGRRQGKLVLPPGRLEGDVDAGRPKLGKHAVGLGLPDVQIYFLPSLFRRGRADFQSPGSYNII